MSNLREMYYELWCLDCGNSEAFRVRQTIGRDTSIDGSGAVHELYGHWGFDHRERTHWKTLKCEVCGSTNVQRKRRYRRVQP